jgi:hypothetical protein
MDTEAWSLLDWIVAVFGAPATIFLVWVLSKTTNKAPKSAIPAKPTDTPSLVSVEENTTEARSVIVEAEEALQGSPEGTGETTWTDEGDDIATRGR